MHKRYTYHPIAWALALLGTILGGVILSATEADGATLGGPTLGIRVGTPQVCTSDHTQGSGIPFYTAGTKWDDNAAITIKHESDVGGDCTAAGYNLGAQLEVFLVDSNNREGCWHWYYTYTTDSDGYKWRVRTIAYLHADKLECWSTATRKANHASQIIGIFLGASQFENTTISVMGTNVDDTVPYPIWYDLDTINDYYWFWRKV